MLKLLKSKTVWGAVIGAVSWLIGRPEIAPTDVITAVGGIISAVGIRDAIRKSASPDSPEGKDELKGPEFPGSEHI